EHEHVAFERGLDQLEFAQFAVLDVEGHAVTGVEICQQTRVVAAVRHAVGGGGVQAGPVEDEGEIVAGLYFRDVAGILLWRRQLCRGLWCRGLRDLRRFRREWSWGGGGE